MPGRGIRLLEAGGQPLSPSVLAVLPEALERSLFDLLRDCGIAVESVADFESATSQARRQVDVLVCTPASAQVVLEDEQRLIAAGLEAAPLILLIDAAAIDGAATLIEHGVYDCVALPPCRAELVGAIQRASAHRRGAAQDHRRAFELSDRTARLEQRKSQLVARVEQLELADEPQRRLTQFIVHDLKNQISIVRSNLSYSLDEELAPEAQSRLQEAGAAVELVLESVLALNPFV